jgi:hypothetical protein
MAETSRLPKIVLGILGIWGLLAAVMLIHTLLDAKQIDKRVSAITTSVSEIDRDTASIGMMQETNRISGELLAASEPLPGTLEAMRGVTAGLAGKVDSILAGTTTIERNSTEIERKVVGARDTAAEINGSVKGIGQSLAGILATLRSTEKAAREINTSTKGLHTTVVALLPVTKAIDTGIATSNRGIAAAADFVVAIRADTGNILAGVPDLLKHARSIDCSPGLILLGGLSGPGEGC